MSEQEKNNGVIELSVLMPVCNKEKSKYFSVGLNSTISHLLLQNKYLL